MNQELFQMIQELNQWLLIFLDWKNEQLFKFEFQVNRFITDQNEYNSDLELQLFWNNLHFPLSINYISLTQYVFKYSISMNCLYTIFIQVFLHYRLEFMKVFKLFYFQFSIIFSPYWFSYLKIHILPLIPHPDY